MYLGKLSNSLQASTKKLADEEKRRAPPLDQVAGLAAFDERAGVRTVGGGERRR